jgi:peptide-methionine (S)-S-oxide reductase
MKILSAAALVIAALATAMLGVATAQERGVALFAGGCFWSMERAFQETPGVMAVVSGYSGGKLANPSYEQVGQGDTGHRETVRIEYDPARVSYAQLLDVYWHHIDPTDDRGQFCDKGSEYRAAIFVKDAAQRKAAEESKAALQASPRFKSAKIATEILPAGSFYPAEDYHQDFYLKNPGRYNAYRVGCGRDARMKAVWGAEAPVH